MVVEVHYRDWFGDPKARTLILDDGCVVATTKTVQTFLKIDRQRVQVFAVRFTGLGKSFTQGVPRKCVQCWDTFCQARFEEPVPSSWRLRSGDQF